MPPINTASKRYFLAVDGLRILASINIVLFHLQGMGGLYDLKGEPSWLFRIIRGPAFHASIFFMLGGFIFTIKFADTASTFNARAFLIKRFKELYPLHIITTGAMAVLKVVHHLSGGDLDVPKLLYSLFMHLSLLWSFYPFGTYALNRPSWALSAFFLCYLLFGPMLRLVVKINRRRTCIFAALGCLVPLLFWGLLFGALGTPDSLYFFFHSFALIRFFEFLLGMVLARFFQLSKPVRECSFFTALFNDLILVATIMLIYRNLLLRTSSSDIVVYLLYHFVMIPLYFILLYCLATERGGIARLLSFPVVRKTGRSSFYPYLIHIPLISTVAYICEHGLGYYKLLHRPVNVVVFMLLLYTGAYVYVNHLRKRKPSGPEGAGGGYGPPAIGAGQSEDASRRQPLQSSDPRHRHHSTMK
ncbi:MAG: acyltransferase [Chitinispirillaceae bacterium]|nr:acyltransferase [Chitinispirillaceae bacterium]